MDKTTRETRRQSYDAVLPKREKRCRLILETLGAREMTASEITEELVAAGEIPYFNRNYVAPRLTEMKQMGILKTVGRRKATRSDATEAVWARAEPSGPTGQTAAAYADNPTEAEQMTLGSQQEVTAMNKATCRGCGAPIVWIKTPAGKAMPCDPAPVYYKAAPGGKDKIVTTRGEVVSCEIVPGGEATDAGYRPHWATCPQAGQFKRGGRARE